MSAEYIRHYYNVPAHRGSRVFFDYDGFGHGTIVAFKGAYIRVRFDNDSTIHTLHPTWKITYEEAKATNR